MDAWEIALNKINELVQAKKLKESVPLKEGIYFFECDQGQFALEVPRRTRGVKGAKFWFSFPPKAPHGVRVEHKVVGVGRLARLTGSRMSKEFDCWSILVGDSQDNPHGIIDAILSRLTGVEASPVPEIAAAC